MYEAMKKFLFCLILTQVSIVSIAQTIQVKLSRAYKVFESDSQLTNALSSLYIVDAKTGKPVFDRNSTIGMAPASTQKIITAATAYGVLGKDFRYLTQFGYTGNMEGGVLNGNLYIIGSGDPTLGSWRWKNHNEESVMGRLIASIKNTGIKKYVSLVNDASGWEGETIPDGWIWQDIGNNGRLVGHARLFIATHDFIAVKRIHRLTQLYCFQQIAGQYQYAHPLRRQCANVFMNT